MSVFHLHIDFFLLFHALYFFKKWVKQALYSNVIIAVFEGRPVELGFSSSTVSSQKTRTRAEVADCRDHLLSLRTDVCVCTQRTRTRSRLNPLPWGGMHTDTIAGTNQQ